MTARKPRRLTLEQAMEQMPSGVLASATPLPARSKRTDEIRARVKAASQFYEPGSLYADAAYLLARVERLEGLLRDAREYAIAIDRADIDAALGDES